MTQDSSGAAQDQAAPTGAADPATATETTNDQQQGVPTGEQPPAGELFDPLARKADEVVAYLETADDAERDRVIAAEAGRESGRVRTSITEWQAKASPAGEDDAKPAHVRPARYDDPSWALGAQAPHAVHRLYGDDAKLGEPRDGEPKAGDRGVIVVQAGDVITRGIRRELTTN